MKKKLLVIAGIMVIAGALVLVNKRQAKTSPAVETAPTTQETTKTPGFGKYLKSARASNRDVFEKDTRLPKACLDYFDALQKIDFFSKGNGDLTYQMLPQPQGCAGEFITGFTATQESYLKKCAPSDTNLSEKISEECASAVFMMRAAVTRLALKDKPIKEITDMIQLADLVFSEFAGAFNGGEQTPDFSKMREISDRMMELNPNLFAAQKVSVLSNLMEGFMAPKDTDTSASWARAQEVVKKGLEAHPNDDMLLDAQTAAETKGFDPVLTKNLSEKMTQDNPNSDRGWYLMAYAQWKQGDHSNSISNLAHAMSLAPNNQDYKKTFAEISKPDANAESFKGAFKVGISNDDFNQ